MKKAASFGATGVVQMPAPTKKCGAQIAAGPKMPLPLRPMTREQRRVNEMTFSKRMHAYASAAAAAAFAFIALVLIDAAFHGDPLRIRDIGFVAASFVVVWILSLIASLPIFLIIEALFDILHLDSYVLYVAGGLVTGVAVSLISDFSFHTLSYHPLLKAYVIDVATGGPIGGLAGFVYRLVRGARECGT